MTALPSVLCPIHAPALGGVERVAMNIMAGFGEAGGAATIALGRGELTSSASVAVWSAPANPLASWFETLWMTRLLAKLVHRTRPALLFLPGNSYAVLVILLKLCLGRACPPTVIKISNDLMRDDMRWPIRSCYRQWCRVQGLFIDRFVALSPEMRDEIAEMMNVATDRVVVIPNPVLTAAMARRLAEAGDLARATRRQGRRFVAAGRLVEQKRFDLMIDAFVAGAHSDDTLRIVGDGPSRMRLQRRIDRLQAGDRIRLEGGRSGADAWLGDADVLLLSSAYEGLPAVVVEALAAGTPVIASRCCVSMAAMLGHGRFGILVPRGDRAAFARAITTIDPDGYDRTGARRIASDCIATVSSTAYSLLFATTARARLTAHRGRMVPASVKRAA